MDTKKKYILIGILAFCLVICSLIISLITLRGTSKTQTPQTQPDDKYPATCQDAKNSKYFQDLISKGASRWTDGDRNHVIHNLGKWGLDPSQGESNDVHFKSLQTCDNMYPATCQGAKNIPYFKNQRSKNSMFGMEANFGNTVIYNLHKWGLSPSQGISNRDILSKYDNCN